MPTDLTLIVFSSRRHAAQAGFAPDGKMFGDPAVHAWWPERGPEKLQGLEFERVIVCETTHITEEERSLILSRCRVGPATYIRL